MSKLNEAIEELGRLSKAIGEKVQSPKALDQEAVAKMIAVQIEKAEVVRKAQYVPGQYTEDEIEKLPMNELILRKSDDEKIKRIQDVNDACLVMGALKKRDPRSFRIYKEAMPIMTDLKKAMYTTATNAGAELIPTILSNQFIEEYRLELKVPALFKQIKMTNKVMDMPIGTGGITTYFVAESTAASPSDGPSDDVDTTKATLTAKKVFGSTVESTEFDEDSVIDNIGLFRTEMGRALAEAVEDCIINGDTASPHMDNDITSSQDRRKMWIGLRGHAVDQSYTTDISTFNAEALANLSAAMGKYGIVPGEKAWILGPKAYHRFLRLKDSSGNRAVLTLNELGNRGTILAGQLGELDGCPIVVSGQARENLNASGFHDLTTQNKTTAILVNTRSFALGTRRGVTIKTFDDIRTDQMIVVGTARHDFQPIYPIASNQTVSVGVNLALTS